MCSVALWLGTPVAFAGGGPANVMVLYNPDDPEALAVAEHYRDARSLPAGQLCPIPTGDPLRRTIPFAEFEEVVLPALDGCLNALVDPDRIDYLVVIRGLPYRVLLAGFGTSFTAMLQVYRAAADDGIMLAGQPQLDGGGYFQASVDNPAFLPDGVFPGDYTIANIYGAWYATAPRIVREEELVPSFRRAEAGRADGFDFAGNLFLVTRLDGFDYGDAHDLIERGVAADGSFPQATLLCMEGADVARGARDPECEFTARHLALAGFNAEYLSPFDGSLAGRELGAYFTGAANLRGAIEGNTFAPGAMACNLTSTGAAPSNFFCDGLDCPASESQTSIARFVRAGATGVHGAVAEPLNNSFPNAGALLLYTFGYNLAESYFFNQRYLYWQNLYLGDPLTTPYAARPVVWLEGPGGTNALSYPSRSTLRLRAEHPNGIASVQVLVDGVPHLWSEGDGVDFGLEADPGDLLDLLLIATADNRRVEREGWPQPNPLPQPDVQGWIELRVAVGEALAPEPSAAAAGCDCGAPAADRGAAVLALLGLVGGGTRLRSGRCG
jgi:uncharacterized protein (TIGR03790 family)